MLVLGRKENESIIIGNNIRVTIVGRCGSSIRVGVQAPNDVRIVREELMERQPKEGVGSKDYGLKGCGSKGHDIKGHDGASETQPLDQPSEGGSECMDLPPACHESLTLEFVTHEAVTHEAVTHEAVTHEFGANGPGAQLTPLSMPSSGAADFYVI